MKKITFITTVDHNVGDDFVREGIKYLLRRYFKKDELQFESVHKHSPITARYGFEWFRNYRLSKRMDELLPLSFTKDRLLEADLVIQSGAPVYWCHDAGGTHCSQNEWYVPLIKRRFLQNKKSYLLNLAAGTCQRYDSDGSEFLKCQKDRNYIRELFSISKVTTVRDALAKKVLNSLELDAPLMPCSSIFAVDEYALKAQESDYVVVNYMEGGSHYTFGQNINQAKWKSEFTKFYNKIKKYERVVFSCHNRTEHQKAKEIDPNAEVFYSTDHLEYMQFYARAKFGIMNRVHGAFLLASFGKPSVVIGNDSRAKMALEIGLKIFFVNDVDCEFLMDQCEDLKSGVNDFTERFSIIRNRSYDHYMRALSVI